MDIVLDGVQMVSTVCSKQNTCTSLSSLELDIEPIVARLTIIVSGCGLPLVFIRIYGRWLYVVCRLLVAHGSPTMHAQ